MFTANRKHYINFEGIQPGKDDATCGILLS